MSYALLKCFSVLLSVTEVPSRALTAVLTDLLARYKYVCSTCAGALRKATYHVRTYLHIQHCVSAAETKMSYALLKCFSVLLSITEVPSRALTAVLTVCSNVRRTDPCIFVRSSYVTSTRMCSNRKLMSSLGEIGTLLLQCIQTKKTTIRSCIQQCTYLTNESCTKSCKQQGFRSLSKLSTETTPGFQYCLR